MSTVFSFFSPANFLPRRKKVVKAKKGRFFLFLSPSQKNQDTTTKLPSTKPGEKRFFTKSEKPFYPWEERRPFFWSNQAAIFVFSSLQSSVIVNGPEMYETIVDQLW